MPTFPKIVTTLGQGGLGRPPLSEDYISGIIFYLANADLPSGFTTTDRIKTIFSTAQAESLGIVADKSDETRATGTIEITLAGTAGDSITATSDEGAGAITLGTYVSESGDTVNDIASGLRSKINEGTAVHGYSATVATDTVTVTAPVGSGADANTYTLDATATGTMTETVVSFAGGVNSKLDVLHFHVSEYFRNKPNGQLYVGIYPVPSAYDFAELETVQKFASGKIRQFGVYSNHEAFNSARVSSLQAVATRLFNDYAPVSIIYTPDISATTDLSTLPDLSGLNSRSVTIDIGQSASGLAKTLYDQKGYSIGSLGTMLGILSDCAVNEATWEVETRNLVFGELYTVAGLSNGALYRDLASGLVTLLNNRKYVFTRGITGITGTWFTQSVTTIANTSDYSTIERNRTIDKVVRLGYVAMTNALGRQVKLNNDGTVAEPDRQRFLVALNNAVGAMTNVDAPEASAIQAFFDPTQKPLVSGKYEVAYRVLPTDTVTEINITVGYTAEIQ